ncbi:MAG: hypothetical protein CJBNEKGG_01601 [Prosthecobacter sp.]|nr:hypothetical protein [Prosthecobacter sp.]
MILILRLFFMLMLASMIGVTGWASLECALWRIPGEVASNPWFIATLADTCWAFLTFYAWLAYKETSWRSRLAWLLAILALGTMAVAAYMLHQLFQVNASAGVEEVLLRRKNS